jgi:CheY-like chemotaxis protein
MKTNRPILVIEDDSDDSDLITSFLKEIQEQEVICFKDGLKALDYLVTTNDKPFIILCDMKMNMMNGLELLKAVQHQEDLRDKCVPFVFLTAPLQQEVVNKVFTYPLQGFFLNLTMIMTSRNYCKQ